jgi:hypothetical protein
VRRGLWGLGYLALRRVLELVVVLMRSERVDCWPSVTRSPCPDVRPDVLPTSPLTEPSWLH